jgi:hypothetical protein
MGEETCEFVRARLEQRRADVRTATFGLTEGAAAAIGVSPEWSALDTLRHILAWQQLALRCLDEWQSRRNLAPAPHDEDRTNAALLTERAGLGLDETLELIAASYARFEGLLAAGDAELAEEALAPWGERVTQLQAISGILWHDGEHLAEIARARSL